MHSATGRLLAPTPAQANQQQLQVASLRSAAEAAGLTKRRKKRRVVYVDDDDNIIGEEDEDEDVTDGPAFSLTIGEDGTVRRGCSSWGHGAALGWKGFQEEQSRGWRGGGLLRVGLPAEAPCPQKGHDRLRGAWGLGGIITACVIFFLLPTQLPASTALLTEQEFSEYDKRGALVRQARTALDFDEEEGGGEEGEHVPNTNEREGNVACTHGSCKRACLQVISWMCAVAKAYQELHSLTLTSLCMLHTPHPTPSPPHVQTRVGRGKRRTTSLTSVEAAAVAAGASSTAALRAAGACSRWVRAWRCAHTQGAGEAVGGARCLALGWREAADGWQAKLPLQAMQAAHWLYDLSPAWSHITPAAW